MMGFGGMHGFWGLGLWGGVIGLTFNIALLAGVAWLVVWAVGRFTSGTANSNRLSGPPAPREILQVRYARGEITREQYQQMLQDLA